MEIHELMTRVERDKAMAPENNATNATSGKATKGSFGRHTIDYRYPMSQEPLDPIS